MEEKADVVKEKPAAVVVEEWPVAVTSKLSIVPCSQVTSAAKWAPSAIAVRPRMQRDSVLVKRN